MNLPESEVRRLIGLGAVVKDHAVRVPTDAPKAAPSPWDDECSPLLFIAACKLHGLPKPVPEYRFHPDRKWRFDFAWVRKKVALEIDGGIWSQGRHTRGKGFIKDQEKRNEALLAGWKVFHCVPADVKDGSVFVLLRRALGL